MTFQRQGGYNRVAHWNTGLWTGPCLVYDGSLSQQGFVDNGDVRVSVGLREGLAGGAQMQHAHLSLLGVALLALLDTCRQLRVVSRPACQLYGDSWSATTR